VTPPQVSGSQTGNEEPAAPEDERAAHLRALAAKLSVDRPIALVGMMGAGKTTVGKRLAAVLGIPFKDADSEIEQAAGRSVSDIFAERGEAEFRRGERQVIARLITTCGPHVLATGGGAFMDAETRALLKERAVTLYLKAELDTLLKRVERRDTRPLLRNGDPRETLTRLMGERGPAYEQADIIVESQSGPHQATVEAALKALAQKFGEAAKEET
jgi:shikimate kinase